MKLPSPQFLTKALTSRPSQHPRFILAQSSLLYSTTTTKPTRSYIRKQQQHPSISPPPPPPPSTTNSFKNDSEKINKPSWSPVERSANPHNEWPRPTEIPWQARVANSVNLIGYVSMPVQFKASSDGKSWAGTVLTQGKLPDVPLWIPVIFEGDLAHTAACHLKEKDYVHVAGQLTGDPPQFPMEQGQTNMQVMVHSLSFVQETVQWKDGCTSYKQKEQVTSSLSTKDSITEKLGTDLLANPHEWLDNRLDKSNAADVDFKHTNSGEKLRIDDSTPGRILSKSESLNFINKTVQKKVNAVRDNDSSWRDLCDHPNQWHDNRKRKLNGEVKPKYPDFSSKEGRMGLWLNTAPGWALSKLNELKFDDTVSKTSYQKDSKAEEDFNAEKLWTDLHANPHERLDNRLDKSNATDVDFKHVSSGEKLRIDESNLGWIVSESESQNFINKAVQKKVNGVKDTDSSWRDFCDNPNQWRDNRKRKLNGEVNPKYPDFSAKEGRMGLWLNTAPGWVLSKLNELKFDATVSKMSHQKDSKENLWKSVVENPTKWWDNRFCKTNPKGPDFRHKETGEVLWLASSPDWVFSQLPPVNSNAVAAGKRETLLS